MGGKLKKFSKKAFMRKMAKFCKKRWSFLLKKRMT